MVAEHIFSAIDASALFDENDLVLPVALPDLRAIIYDGRPTQDLMVEELSPILEAEWTDQWRQAGSCSVTIPMVEWLDKKYSLVGQSTPLFQPYFDILAIIDVETEECVAAGWVATVNADNEADTITINAIGHEDYLGRHPYQYGYFTNTTSLDPWDLLRDYSFQGQTLTSMDAGTRGVNVSMADYFAGARTVGDTIEKILEEHSQYRFVPTIDSNYTFRFHLTLRDEDVDLDNSVILDSSSNCDFTNLRLDGTGAEIFEMNGTDHNTQPVLMVDAQLRRDRFALNAIEPGEVVTIRPDERESFVVGSDAVAGLFRVTSRSIKQTATEFLQTVTAVPKDSAP